MSVVVPQNPVQMFLTEQEADIVQWALSRYDGPYSDDQKPSLTQYELDRSVKMVIVAQAICNNIKEELMNRYYASFEHEHYDVIRNNYQID